MSTGTGLPAGVRYNGPQVVPGRPTLMLYTYTPTGDTFTVPANEADWAGIMAGVSKVREQRRMTDDSCPLCQQETDEDGLCEDHGIVAVGALPSAEAPSDEQLNIAICEWLGWVKINRLPRIGFVGVAPTDDPTGFHYVALPCHITGIESLGHMHEAEKGLTDEQHRMFRSHLWEIVDKEERNDQRALVSSTARQRAIALLRVVNPEMFQ